LSRVQPGSRIRLQAEAGSVTPAEQIAKAERAQRAMDEFITPLLTETRDVYARRIVEIATTELGKESRTDKITALSTAIRILDELEQGIAAVLMDGEIAKQDRLRADKLENMTPAERRLFGLVPAR
jgi:hypothetical protein